uniref:Cytochrome P450 n=1 Tax=Leptobrachium leishanense TaxID=445787 RepID=A0A8C5PV27_9ANUR
MFPSLMKRVPGPHQKIFTYFKALENILIEQINSHLETLDAANPRDYMDCFLIRMKQEQMKNTDTPFDIPNLLSTVFDLFIGGAETAAVTLRYGFLILTKYPEIQEKLQLEIEEVIGHTREPSVDDRNNTPYLNAFIHEVQRFSDVLPMGVARRATKDLNFRGYLIPEGMDVLPLLTTVLHDPSQFEKPRSLTSTISWMKTESLRSTKRFCLSLLESVAASGRAWHGWNFSSSLRPSCKNSNSSQPWIPRIWISTQ